MASTPGTEYDTADDAFNTNGATPLSEAEKEVLREELRKTEAEIATLREVLNSRQKHSADLKRKLGLNPLTEITQDISKGLKTVTETDAYKKTTEVASATADTVKTKFSEMRNSPFFKSFESKIGSAYNNAKIAASTSIDHLSGHAKEGTPSQAQTPSDASKPPPS